MVQISIRGRLFLGAAIAVGAGVVLLSPCVASAEGLESANTVAQSFASTDEGSLASSSARMIGGLFLCLGVFALGVKIFRRYAPGSQVVSRRRLEIVDRVQLSSKSSLLLVTVDNREFLIARGSETVQIVPNQSGPADLFAESLDSVATESEAYNA